MRVAVDARELCGHRTGVGRYLGELLNEWSASAEAARHEWTLYAHERPDVPSTWADRVRLLAGNGGTAWEQSTLARALRRDRPDVFFAPGYTAPLLQSVPTVQTIHDVSYFAHPEWFSAREGMRRRAITRWSARRARLVLTDSEFSRAEIARYLHLPEARLRVIPLGMRHGDPPPASTTAREPLVLYVGSVFDRRRVDQLITSFDRIVARVPAARLEIVGENRTAHPRLDLAALRDQSTHADRIAIRSYVDESTLRGLYARASVFAFLSEYEGFGLTPLEALAAGVPPVVLDTPVAREVCGPAARYIPASSSTDALVDTVSELLTSVDARSTVMGQASEVLSRYDWAKTAASTLASIEAGAHAE